MGKDFHLMFFEYSQLLPKFSPVQKGILRLQHSLENLNIDISTPSFKNFFRNHLLQLNNSDDLSTTLLTDTSPHPCSTGLVSRITFHFFFFFFPLGTPFFIILFSYLSHSTYWSRVSLLFGIDQYRVSCECELRVGLQEESERIAKRGGRQGAVVCMEMRGWGDAQIDFGAICRTWTDPTYIGRYSCNF